MSRYVYSISYNMLKYYSICDRMGIYENQQLLTTNQGVGGSNPPRCTISQSFVIPLKNLNGTDTCGVRKPSLRLYAIRSAKASLSTVLRKVNFARSP